VVTITLLKQILSTFSCFSCMLRSLLKLGTSLFCFFSTYFSFQQFFFPAYFAHHNLFCSTVAVQFYIIVVIFTHSMMFSYMILNGIPCRSENPEFNILQHPRRVVWWQDLWTACDQKGKQLATFSYCFHYSRGGSKFINTDTYHKLCTGVFS